MVGMDIRDKARRAVLRLLAARDRSTAEIAGRLYHLQIPEETVKEIVAEFQQLGYLDDRLFSRRRARYLAVERLYGDRRIAADLREKGIDSEEIVSAIAEIRSELTEEAALAALLQRKYAASSRSGNEKAKRRLTAQLLGRGFPIHLIHNVIEHHEEVYGHGDDIR